MKTEKILKILRDGNIVIPKLVLKNYKDLGLTEQEFIILLYFFGGDNYTLYNPAEIAKYTGYELEQILQIVDSLSQKKIIEIKVEKNNDGIYEEHASIDPLYEKITYLISDLTGKISIEEKEKISKNIFSTFEEEFARTLSPMEYELIMKWIEEGYHETIIIEALREAILNDVKSLRYIDRILLEWHKKGLDSVAKVREYSKNYKANNKSEKPVEEVFRYNWLDNE